jgi:metal-dependent HD superfamily phosphatase/phosphodiesterase
MTVAPAPSYTFHSTPGTAPLTGHGTFSVPARHNPRLQALVERINADEELRQLWRCANLNAVERLGLSDHGETHVRIVANAGLRLLRLLMDAGQPASIVLHHGLTREDAELVVVLAAALHDLGLAVHYERHQELGLALIPAKARELLTGLYPVRDRTTLIAEVMHAVVTHFNGLRCLTLEAGVLRIADALDMTKGRSRGLEKALTNGVEEVTLHRGTSRPVRVQLRVTQPAGLTHIEMLLRERLRTTPLIGQIEVFAQIETAADGRRLEPLRVDG